ncbi:MAG: undecaprenyldiphospho-muramoylpentapeptide beta-N-acetylglucosaminyltransferase [Balneolaceae bacterium]
MMIAAKKNISTRVHGTDGGAAPRVLFAAGGTGGHVYPAIAIADALKEAVPSAEVLFVGTRDRMEWEAVPRAGYRIESIWISGLHRTLTTKNLLFPLKLVVSLWQSWRILKWFRPDLVVACGGFAAGPAGWMASRTGIPLILQEQNSIPGATNRLLSGKAARVFTAFEEAEKWFPSEKVSRVGNPVRSDIGRLGREESLAYFGFEEERPVVFVTGGSGGAVSLNEAMERGLERLHDAGLQIVWQCGGRYLDELKGRVEEKRYPSLRLVRFVDHMPAAYGAADLVVCRAGAITCSELMRSGSAALLVPSPHVAGDHQNRNAEAMLRAGAAELLPDSEVRVKLADRVLELLSMTTELEEMRNSARRLDVPMAAEMIVKEMLNRVRRSRK